MFALQRHEAAAAATTQILPRGATKKGERERKQREINEKPKVKTSNMFDQKVRLGQVRFRFG